VSTVVIVFPHQGLVGTVSLPWVKNKTVKDYFHEPAVKQYGLCAKKKHHKVYTPDGTTVKLNYSPKEGERLTMIRVR